MSQRNKASYKRIGFTVFIGLAAIVGTLIYLGGLRGCNDEVLLETYYDKPVSGLTVGSVVNFRGVKLGEVREISFVGRKYDVDDADATRIYILMAIKASLIGRNSSERDYVTQNILKYARYRGMRATVTTSGITGLSRVELDFVKDVSTMEPPPVSWTPRHPYVPARVSLMENFSVAATKVMNQINRMDLASVWSNISYTVESLARLSESSKTMLQARQGDFERVVDNMMSTTDNLRALTSELRQNPSLLVRERMPRRLDETE